ncbi:MAG: hypothetical protein ACKVIO_02830 [Phycisphaerales bacterium]
MIGGAVLIVLLMLFMPEIVELMQSLNPQSTNAEQVVVTIGEAQ